jgi:hypothetical protein
MGPRGLFLCSQEPTATPLCALFVQILQRVHTDLNAHIFSIFLQFNIMIKSSLDVYVYLALHLLVQGLEVAVSLCGMLPVTRFYGMHISHIVRHIGYPDCVLSWFLQSLRSGGEENIVCKK